ncbi:hypothetical protein BaRGS_00035452, partial [Batillaria attramentaria]
SELLSNLCEKSRNWCCFPRLKSVSVMHTLPQCKLLARNSASVSVMHTLPQCKLLARNSTSVTPSSSHTLTEQCLHGTSQTDANSCHMWPPTKSSHNWQRHRPDARHTICLRVAISGDDAIAICGDVCTRLLC